MITGISHITLIVANMERTASLLKVLFNAEEVYSSGDLFFSVSKEKFFIVSGIWIALMEGNPVDQRSYNHIAFQIRENEFDEYARKILELDVEILPSRQRVQGEGRSLYFYDYDNHLFEFHTGSLEERLIRYRQPKHSGD